LKGQNTRDAEALAKGGYRVLAFASGEYQDFKKKEVYENEDIPALTFYGLVGFIDPLRPEAKKSVEQCNQAGIKVIMITGDHPETAGTIARELGIADTGTHVLTDKCLRSRCTDSPAYEKWFINFCFCKSFRNQKLEIVMY
jgi:magnesium-transporting ATPase (P-type)